MIIYNGDCRLSRYEVGWGLLCASREPEEARVSCLTGANAAPSLEFMDVRLSPDQEAFVRQAIEAGRFREPEEAVREALSLWEERERRRLELVAAIEEGDECVARGDVITIDTPEAARALADRIKMAGRKRLEAERNLKR
jgi:putative addiction module CopG family antidote